jgi:hypothetical protein
MHGDKFTGDRTMRCLVSKIAGIGLKPRIRVIELEGHIFDDIATVHLRVDGGAALLPSVCRGICRREANPVGARKPVGFGCGNRGGQVLDTHDSLLLQSCRGNGKRKHQGQRRVF